MKTTLMKTLKLAPILLLSLTVSLLGNASPEKAKPSNRGKSQLGTSFHFDGSNLSGKYQNSPGTTALIEDDKFIDDLLGARKTFTDRINKDRARN